MAKTNQEIYNEIVAHMNSEGGLYSNWYAGITSNIESRLHGDHGVPKTNHWFMTRPAASSADARIIEEALHKLGCDGGPGGGDTTSSIVYCYKKTSITNP